VLRAGGQDLDLVARRQPLGDQPAVVLGSAENLRAVALDDKSNLHALPGGFAPPDPPARSLAGTSGPAPFAWLTGWRSCASVTHSPLFSTLDAVDPLLSHTLLCP